MTEQFAVNSASTPESLAFFGVRQADLTRLFVQAALSHLKPKSVLALARDEKATKSLRRALGKQMLFDWVDYDAIGLHRVPINFSAVRVGILARVRALPDPQDTILVVDMAWGLDTASATANFESWMSVAVEVSLSTGTTIVSIYNRGLLIDEHLLAALRGHPKILAPEGVLANPHWLPPAIAQATLREQVNHWLGGIAPSLIRLNPNAARHAAEGADPMWLIRRGDDGGTKAEDGRERWKIRCFGRLRVYRADGSQVQWAIGGGATLKTKTLFAYLLQQGGKGARTDDLADLLWPEADSIATGRNRLYHAVRCLRQALAGPRDGAGDGHLLRDGESYVLVPPDRSWLDISSFEQLCRQSQSHIKAGDLDEALICLQAADRLYTGDLFEDIPSEYVDDTERDWCWTRRYWLRDMFLKVQRDAARIYRQRGEHSAALNHCKKALAIDPLAEFAHEEAMQVFAAQNRREAIERQYALYLKSLSRFDDRPRSEELTRTYRSLLK